MAESKNILKDALSKLNETEDKSVIAGAKESKPDVSNPNGGDVTTAHETNETGTSESEKSVTKDTEKCDDMGKKADDSEKSAKKSDHDEALQHGMQADNKVDNSGHTDADDDSDDDVEDSMNGKAFSQFCKSIDTQSETIKSFDAKMDSFNETMKSLPDILSEAIGKSIDEHLDKAVIASRNTKDLTRSEKDVDDSQDQSQKDADDGSDDSDDEVEESVASGHNTKDLTQSEKSATKADTKDIDSSKNKTDAEGNPKAVGKSVEASKDESKEEVKKSLEGESRAVQEAAPEEIDDSKKEEVKKSADEAEIKTALTPNEVVEKSLDIESGIADKKASINPNDIRAWDKLDSVYQLAKSARAHASEEILNKAQEAFDNLK